MNASPEHSQESTEPTRLGESLDDVRATIEHNAELSRDVARAIIAHQTEAAERGDPQASPETLAAAEEQLRLTQATLDRLKNSQQSPEDDG